MIHTSFSAHSFHFQSVKAFVYFFDVLKLWKGIYALMLRINEVYLPKRLVPFARFSYCSHSFAFLKTRWLHYILSVTFSYQIQCIILNKLNISKRNLNVVDVVTEKNFSCSCWYFIRSSSDSSFNVFSVCNFQNEDCLSTLRGEKVFSVPTLREDLLQLLFYIIKFISVVLKIKMIRWQ